MMHKDFHKFLLSRIHVDNLRLHRFHILRQILEVKFEARIVLSQPRPFYILFMPVSFLIFLGDTFLLESELDQIFKILQEYHDTNY